MANKVTLGIMAFKSLKVVVGVASSVICVEWCVICVL